MGGMGGCLSWNSGIDGFCALDVVFILLETYFWADLN
jgi:hypothetical protein